jgi:hypothetical protein
MFERVPESRQEAAHPGRDPAMAQCSNALSGG